MYALDIVQEAVYSPSARIRLRHPFADNLTLAETHAHAEFEFHEVAPAIEGSALLEWNTGGGRLMRGRVNRQ